MDEATKPERTIEDLPVEAEQAAEVKGGPTAVEMNADLNYKALNFTYVAPIALK